MQGASEPSLEGALGRTEADAIATIKAADAVVRSLRKLKNAAAVGDLGGIRSSIEAADKAMAVVRQQFANAKEGWTFDDESYLAGGAYSRELLEAGKKLGVKIFEQDDRVYCYPSLVRVSAKDKVVFIDGRRESHLHPTKLANRLKDLQHRPPRFRPAAFLESLFEAYQRVAAVLAAKRPQSLLSTRPDVSLSEVYDTLTLLPGQSRDYSKQEFVRDVYLLDRSGVDTVKSGEKVRFHASTGTKTPSRTLTVIAENGEPKHYFSIRFLSPEDK